jgi:hypothetical protein
MNKQAAEKIATEYYNYGIQLALQQAGLIKKANKSRVNNKVKQQQIDSRNFKKKRGLKNTGSPVKQEAWNPNKK